MGTMPMPVRLAAGLVATAVEEARDLPRMIVGWPVTAVSRVLQVSMRLQQRVTALAIKGDQALSALRGVPETPEWAVFDDERGPDHEGGPDHERGSANGRRDPLAPAEPECHDPRSGAEGVVLGSIGRDSAAEDDTGPGTLPGYDALTIAQLRGRLRTLSLDQLQELLAWETTHQDRPPFLTMLANRIATVTAAQG